MIRLNHELSPKKLQHLNSEFKDILTGGEIKPSAPVHDEVKTGEHLALPRLTIKFNMRSFARLCEMIHEINR